MDSDDLPKSIAVEGPIGVGKTSLALLLSETLGYEPWLESSETNPFLKRFYENQRQAALQTQLFFLFERARQLQAMRQSQLFNPLRVTDFLMEKDQLFAKVNLDADELKLYDNIYQHLSIESPAPDLVIYLQAPADVLVERIKQRGNRAEQNIDKLYITQLVDAYTSFFHHYETSPLLIVNASMIDPVSSESDYEELLDFIVSIKQGRHYYNPVPNLL
ncbi:MAG TPA: deoxynucleoside kinase [Gammaproteobacteria bacterium]|nr:deoxynucleoside kinase [Gammaproteobacteria bacterium]